MATELKRLRETIGVLGDDVAAALGWSQSKVSRVETARIGINLRDLATLLHYYGAPLEVHAELMAATADAEGVPGAWIVQASGPRHPRAGTQPIGSRATSVRQYSPLTIPGQLQPAADPSSPSYTLLLDARVFLSWPGDVSRRQVHALRDRAQKPGIVVKVIPLGVEQAVTAATPFTIYEFPAAPTVVHVATQTADLYLSAATDVRTYGDVFDRLVADALDISAPVQGFEPRLGG
ncbi:Scr1 family TA system antitoxin-like transcriptional regulator [Micromonospora pisi]|uniref:Scr1 family TA system antitoxin-like transcriptional regulator n=1 Tax=Micromonospora pisi TaxID=589240 RepID=UPI003CCC5B03